MAQSTVILPTTGTLSGIALVTAINAANQTLLTNSSGTSAPSVIVAGQFWHDTTANVLNIRSMDNTAWIPLFYFDETNFGSTILKGRTVTASSATMTNADGIVNIDHAGAVTVAGASGRTPFKPYTIKDSGGNAYANNITYTPNSGDIDGAATLLITQNYDSVTIYSDGTNEFTM